MHTNKEFLATCLKGLKDSKQQLAVRTPHRPRDTCWVGEATAPRNLVAWGGDVAAVSVQAFWSPPLCSSHTAYLCKESAFLLADTTHGVYYVPRPSAHSAPCSQDLVRFLYPLQKKYLATFYFLIIFKLFSPHNDTLRKALLLFPNHRWGNWGQVSWDELTEVLQVVSDRVWLSLQSVTAGSCSPFSPVLTEFYFCVLKFFLFFGWATRLVGS